MKAWKDIRKAMENDDVVTYIAGRHHTTACHILDICFPINGADAAEESIILEDNEINIIHDLMELFKNKAQ